MLPLPRPAPVRRFLLQAAAFSLAQVTPGSLEIATAPDAPIYVAPPIESFEQVDEPAAMIIAPVVVRTAHRMHPLGEAGDLIVCLTCSPKLVPVAVRVSTARCTGKEIHDEATQATLAGPDGHYHKVKAQGGQAYRAACELAQLVGIDLSDG